MGARLNDDDDPSLGPSDLRAKNVEPLIWRLRPRVRWLAAGWRDLIVQPLRVSVTALVFAISLVMWSVLFRFGWDYILFPAFAGFMVVGPMLAVGLYEKSRRIAAANRSSWPT